MICIFWPEFWLKTRCIALHVTKKCFKNIVPPSIRDHIDSVDCTLGYKAIVGRRYRMKEWYNVLKKKTFPFDVMQSTVGSIQILAKIYKPRLKEYAYHKIQPYYDQWKMFLYRKFLFSVPLRPCLWAGCAILPSVFLVFKMDLRKKKFTKEI